MEPGLPAGSPCGVTRLRCARPASQGEALRSQISSLGLPWAVKNSVLTGEIRLFTEGRFYSIFRVGVPTISEQGAGAVTTTKEYKSPVKKLAEFFERSRDAWKQKYQDVKRQLRSSEHQRRAVEQSRRQWRRRAEAAEAELKTLKKTLHHQPSQPKN
jgi:hypothetical protein